MPDGMPQTNFFAARPTIRVDGTAQGPLADEDLMSVLVEETTLGLFRCEASFRNWGSASGAVGFTYFDRKVLDFGRAFSIEFGAPGVSGPVFAGRITAIEGRYPSGQIPEVLVLAEDRLQDLRMERRTRSFENLSDADIVRRIAAAQSLQAQVDVDGPTHRIAVQLNQSDLAFLRERAAAVDAELWIDNKTIYVQARARRNAGSVSLTYGKDLLEFTATADLAHQRSTVRVTGWSVADKQPIKADATDAALRGELTGLQGGGGILAGALAPHTETVALATPLAQPEAQALAEARYRERARGFVRGTGVTDGNPKVRVSARLTLSGLGPLFDGDYTVTRARHSFTLRDGFRTTFDVERPGIGT